MTADQGANLIAGLGLLISALSLWKLLKRDFERETQVRSIQRTAEAMEVLAKELVVQNLQLTNQTIEMKDQV